MKDILLDIFATMVIGLIYLIGIGLVIALIVFAIIGCVALPKIVIPIVVILLSYIIGLAIKNDQGF